MNNDELHEKIKEMRDATNAVIERDYDNYYKSIEQQTIKEFDIKESEIKSVETNTAPVTL